MTIYPEDNNFPAVARALLEAAEHPHQVRYVSHPKAGFEVPEDVYERFEALLAGPAEEPVERKRRAPRTKKTDEPAAVIPATEPETVAVTETVEPQETAVPDTGKEE